MSIKRKGWFIGIGAAFVILLVVLLSTIGYQRIDAGHVGIKVNLYGTAKGVQDVTKVTGAVWYNRITTEIYEFPTFVQNKVYTRSSEEGGTKNQEFAVSTKDGSNVSFDVSINYRIKEDKVSSIFKKYRKTLSELNETIIYNYLRDAFNAAAAEVTCEQLYSGREKFKGVSDSILRSMLEPEGFVIEQIIILGKLRLPKSVGIAIDAKVKAKETATKKQEELVSAEADAQKHIANARGKGEAAKIAATAKAEAIKIEADANSKLQKSLTPQILRKMWIDKWNGKLPSTMAGGDASVLLNLK